MDFSNILTTLNDLIPPSIFGIDTLYIGGGLLILLLVLLLILRRSSKSPAKRDLHDLTAEESQEEVSPESDVQEVEPEEVIEETEEEPEVELEDGFMPSNVSAAEPEAFETEESAEVEELSVEEEPSVEEEVQDEPAPITQRESVNRKKRESTRNGRKISKADFADFSGQRLLIAEDNLINQKVINGVLNESGIEVVMADDGQFVMEALEKDPNFEIILMDAHMPRVDGFEATRMIRETPAYDHITVIALSGDTAVDDIRHMKEAGMEECLEKPLKMDALYDVMSMYYTLDEESEEAPVVKEEVDELEISVDIDDLACLDYDHGLEICGNDEAMYKELLKEFFIGYKDSSKKMHKALVDKDYAQAQEILIDVKGTASNLGAVQFITITEHFLQALANENTAAYAQMFKDYQKYLLALLKSIQAAFES